MATAEDAREVSREPWANGWSAFAASIIAADLRILDLIVRIVILDVR